MPFSQLIEALKEKYTHVVDEYGKKIEIDAFFEDEVTIYNDGVYSMHNEVYAFIGDSEEEIQAVFERAKDKRLNRLITQYLSGIGKPEDSVLEDKDRIIRVMGQETYDRVLAEPRRRLEARIKRTEEELQRLKERLL